MGNELLGSEVLVHAGSRCRTQEVQPNQAGLDSWSRRDIWTSGPNVCLTPPTTYGYLTAFQVRAGRRGTLRSRNTVWAGPDEPTGVVNTSTLWGGAGSGREAQHSRLQLTTPTCACLETSTYRSLSTKFRLPNSDALASPPTCWFLFFRPLFGLPVSLESECLSSRGGCWQRRTFSQLVRSRVWAVRSLQ